MIEAFLVAILLLLLALLFLAHHRWECSSFVKTIDLIPGPKRKPIVGNATSLPRESHRRLLKTLSDIIVLNAPPFSYQIWNHYLNKNCIDEGHHKSIFLNRLTFDFIDCASVYSNKQTLHIENKYLFVSSLDQQKSCKPSKGNG